MKIAQMFTKHNDMVEYKRKHIFNKEGFKMSDEIHNINNYKSRYDYRDLFTVLEIEHEVLEYFLTELNLLVANTKIALLNFKKKKNIDNKEIYRNSLKAYYNKEREFETILVNTSFVDDLDSTIAPYFFQELINKIGYFETVKRLHSESLKVMFTIINKDEALIEKVEQELRTINISYKQAKYLVRAILKSNEDDYLKVCRVIEKNFLKLPMVMIKTDCEEAIIGCLRGDKYLNGSHSNFDRVHTDIDFPEVYLIKFAISKALN